MFDITQDPHEQKDLFSSQPEKVVEGKELLQTWTEEQLDRSYSSTDPMEVVLEEGGPFHVRGHLSSYLERLEKTGRSRWAEILRERHEVGK